MNQTYNLGTEDMPKLTPVGKEGVAFVDFALYFCGQSRYALDMSSRLHAELERAPIERAALLTKVKNLYHSIDIEKDPETEDKSRFTHLDVTRHAVDIISAVLALVGHEVGRDYGVRIEASHVPKAILDLAIPPAEPER